MLERPIPPAESPEEALSELGLEQSGAGIILLAQLRKAAAGELNAAKFLRELAEQPAAAATAEGKAELGSLSDGELWAMLAAAEAGT